MKRLFLGCALICLLLAVSAPPALAGPALIGGSLKAGYSTFDHRVTYGFEVEIMSYAVIQYMTAPGLTDIALGYRYYLPIDKPYNLNFAILEGFRINDLSEYDDMMTSAIIGFDYDGGWWYIGAELGGGLSYAYMRPYLVLNARLGVHYEF